MVKSLSNPKNLPIFRINTRDFTLWSSGVEVWLILKMGEERVLVGVCTAFSLLSIVAVLMVVPSLYDKMETMKERITDGVQVGKKFRRENVWLKPAKNIFRGNKATTTLLQLSH